MFATLVGWTNELQELEG